MKLKCIGGPSDGKVIEVPDSYINTRVGFTVYTRRLLHHVGANQECLTIQYLAPSDVSDMDSLRPLLEP